MNESFHETKSPLPSRKQALVILVAASVVLALAGFIFALAFSGWSHRVTHEVYDYFLFVRVQAPETNAEVWVPVPDFSELRDRVSVDETWVPFDEFPTRNVSQTISQTAYGTMYRFVFSESFALYGSVQTVPGSANGTLTFSSQVSNDVRIYLANVSASNQVSIILYYEVAQALSSFECNRHFFVSTADPRGNTIPGMIAGQGYVGEMVRDENAYTVLSSGWGAYPLVDGGFAACGT